MFQLRLFITTTNIRNKHIITKNSLPAVSQYLGLKLFPKNAPIRYAPKVSAVIYLNNSIILNLVF